MSLTDTLRAPLAAANRQDRHPAWLAFALLLLALVAALLIWSRFAVLEEVTMGSAQIVPSGKVQVIQSLEGGIVSALKVHEGDLVEAGQPLIVIDPTRAESSFNEMERRRRSLLASAARLRAEAAGLPLQFPQEIAGDADLIRYESETYRVRRAAVDQSTAGLSGSIALMRRELAITAPMSARGLVPEVDVLRLRRQINEAQMQISERTNRYRADAGTELSKVESELSQVSEVVTGRRDALDRTVLRAPMRGTVKNVQVTTIGGVVQPGAPVLEIVPFRDVLLVEAKIRPSDVAFIRPGQGATVKLAAYNYLIYGALKGKVETISPDTLREDRKANEEAFYRVLISTGQSALVHDGKTLPIIPGMTGTVEILTGRRTVWDYFLRPVLKVEEAFRER
ncbi:HlyD family type I secretion periplasmic adaptor subunit [Sphingobium bisphenolivorans]|uniref:HlyD family type I secretion periplasmic adaptor subunit n=1 Tax=Sphingobium bisphenolivorans TaxID=1335760 RepID=UPI0003A5484C|nr:HlyD family type I secretion periplasmic adaptor subunit [Sphingobium bisphenolivorans]